MTITEQQCLQVVEKLTRMLSWEFLPSQFNAVLKAFSDVLPVFLDVQRPASPRTRGGQTPPVIWHVAFVPRTAEPWNGFDIFDLYARVICRKPDPELTISHFKRAPVGRGIASAVYLWTKNHINTPPAVLFNNEELTMRLSESSTGALRSLEMNRRVQRENARTTGDEAGNDVARTFSFESRRNIPLGCFASQTRDGQAPMAVTAGMFDGLSFENERGQYFRNWIAEKTGN